VSDLLSSEVLSIPVFAELRQDQLDEVLGALGSFSS
jgi:dTDP-4-amino-4,6-dideoxygalactose transaminase